MRINKPYKSILEIPDYIDNIFGSRLYIGDTLVGNITLTRKTYNRRFYILNCYFEYEYLKCNGKIYDTSDECKKALMLDIQSHNRKIKIENILKEL